jgi:hypothetical protein
MDSDVSVTNSTEASVMGLTCYLKYQMNKPINIAGVVLPPAAQPSDENSAGSAPPTPVAKTTTTVLVAVLAAAAVTLFSVAV